MVPPGVTRNSFVVGSGMATADLINDERDLILAGLFELTLTYIEDDEKRERCKALAARSAAIPPRCSTGQ